MTQKDPYQIIKHQHVTEKAQMLARIKKCKSNPSLARFELPKYVFIVDRKPINKKLPERLKRFTVTKM